MKVNFYGFPAWAFVIEQGFGTIPGFNPILEVPLKNNVREVYDDLAIRLKEKSRLEAIMGILHWDQEVIMPKGGAGSRAQQMAALAGVLHEKSTDPELGGMLDRLLECPEAQFNEYEWRIIQEANRDYTFDTRVPRQLVQELAELSSNGHAVWAQAREENKFELFPPTLKRLVELKTQWAQCVAPEKSAYDANIDIFERDATVEKIAPLFTRLKSELIPLIQAIVDRGDPVSPTVLEGRFSLDKQEALGKKISEAMGFSFENGRLDVSLHPFSGGGDFTDVRITTRYREDNFVESLYAVIHETGHALYEQGRMKEWEGLPVSESLTMGIHESQSLFWERMIAQGKPFLNHFLPLFRETFPKQLNGISMDTLYGAINRVHPSLIRVEADEVTYPLHVILRFEIEQGLFEGSIPVADLPEVWNKKMEEYLGVRPLTDREGVLQDVHWSGGAFGYFPSYTLGAMYACQFFLALKKENPEIENLVACGALAPVKDWLNRNIHARGRLYPAEDLCRQVTGESLNPDHFINYLKSKYGELYGLNGQTPH